nr:LOW QUALITY PROTEIN: tRNA-specific adenosine deaminase 1-like [Lepeophtheirus salmonis]
MDIGHRVASAVLKHYQDVVPRKWKPRNGEWTVLSAFILEDVGSGTLEVVSLGSGTKCLGVTQLSLQGDAIHDSHGEVLARRGFKRYLLSEVLKFNESKTGILRSKEDFKAFPKKIHFFFDTSSMWRCNNNSNDADGPSKSKKSRVEGPDIHRTGAKCVANQVMMDEHLPGVGYHVVGAVRTKPGRGSPTKSLSCSDKMLKWNYFGTCGDILKRFWFPSGLHWSSITINCQIEDKDSIKESLQRALIDRCSAPFGTIHLPLICTSHLSFEYDLKMDESNKASPCANSICWSKVANEPLAMLSEGRKFGLAKKHYSSRKSILPISRLKLAEFALHIMMQEKSDRISYIWSKKYQVL